MMTNHTGAAADPYGRQQSFSGRVLLAAVVILFALTVVFVALRVLLYMCCAFGGGGSRGRGGGGLAAGIRRSINSFGTHAQHSLLLEPRAHSSTNCCRSPGVR